MYCMLYMYRVLFWPFIELCRASIASSLHHCCLSLLPPFLSHEKMRRCKDRLRAKKTNVKQTWSSSQLDAIRLNGDDVATYEKYKDC